MTTTMHREPSPRRVLLHLLGGLLLAMLLASLDQTIVSTALPTIVGELGGIDQLSWVVTAYLLAATVTIPLWGRAERPLRPQAPVPGGHRRLPRRVRAQRRGADRSAQLIAFRALQGLGAGGLMTLAMAIVADIVSAARARPLPGLHPDGLRARQRRGPAARRPVRRPPLVALGLLRQPADRRARARGRQHDARADGRPAAARGSTTRAPTLLAAALTSILLLTTWGGREHAWDSAPILGLAAAAVALLGGFVARERRAPSRSCRCGCSPTRCSRVVAVVLFLTTCAFFAAIVFTPLYLQLVTGASATSSGLLLLPLCSPRPRAPRSPGARSRAPAATSASRSPGWR